MYEQDPRSDTRDTDVFRWILLAAVVLIVGGAGLLIMGGNDSTTRTANAPAVTEPAQPQKPTPSPQ